MLLCNRFGDATDFLPNESREVFHFVPWIGRDNRNVAFGINCEARLQINGKLKNLINIKVNKLKRIAKICTNNQKLATKNKKTKYN